jgi:hypothetical protein
VPAPAAPPAAAADAAARLRQLQSMLDEGLITQEEYETKRAEIIEKM